MNDTSKSTVSPSLRRAPTPNTRPNTAFVEFKPEETEQSIGDRFEKTVGQYSERIAVKDKSCELTYDELNKLANRIAHSILSQYKVSGQPVALLLGHRAQTIAAILGVLKSGNLYVPLDPDFPHSRNSFILSDSQCSVVVTNNENLSLAKHLVQDSRQLLNIDCIDRAVPDDNVRRRISPDDLAYILYTSGSTGQPKGVIQNHRNVLRIAMRFTQGFRISFEDRLLFLVSFSVGAAVGNMLGTLLNGASVFLFNVKAEGVSKLADWLINNDITIYRSVPSVFRHFVASLTGAEKFPKLRLVRLGGDRVYRSDFELYKKHFSDNCVFLNGYGTSEMPNLFQYRIDKTTQIDGDVVPVGWPLDDTTFSLIDESGKTVGYNTTGEIVIKSRYVIPRYWHRPELTQAVFLSDPRDDVEHTYHTGDTGYLLPDGCLVHTGRKDFQTKIRGFRVELGEIERVLCTLPTVIEAVVVARKDRFAENQLVAYVVTRSGHTLESAEVRRFLAERVPDYMIPPFFVPIEALPLTPNGKVDRSALPEPDITGLAAETSFVPPNTPVEEVVARIWSDVLGIEQVGMRNNFFELGGNSLSANMIVLRLRDTFRIEVSLRSFLEAPTVAELVAEILQDPAKRTRVEKIAKLVISMSRLSDTDAKAILDRKLEPR